MNLSIVEIAVVRLDRIAVRFSHIPRSTSPSRSSDALSPAAYSLSGPGSLSVRSVEEDLADLTRFELQLSGPLSSGGWTLQAANIASPAADILVSQSVPFSYPPTYPPPSRGSSASYDIVAQAIGPAMTGPNWSAIIKALGWSAQLDANYALFGLSQLFLDSASERWLTKRAAEIGLARSAVSGISDEAFRYLAVSFWWGKLIQPGLLSMLDAVWGPDLIRATAETEGVEPFAIFGGEQLAVRANRTVRLLTIPVGSIAVPGAATAVELAAALSSSADTVALPAYFDVVRSAGGTKVRAVSSGIGLESKLSFLGGSAQAVLRFPTRIAAFAGGTQPTWTIAPISLDATTELTCVDPTGEDLSGVEVGDYVIISGSEFLPANRGTFAVTAVSVTVSGGSRTQKIALANPDGAAQVVAQLSEPSLLIFRPVVIGQPAYGPVLTQADGNLSIVLPTTSLVVRRDLLSAGYPQDGAAIVGTASRLDGTVTVAAPGHNVAVGDTVDFGVMIPNFADAPTTAGAGALSDYSAKSIWSSAPSMSAARSSHLVVGLASGGALAVGGWDGAMYLDSAEIFSVSAETNQPDGGRQLTSSWVAASPRPIAASKACGIRLTTTDGVLVAGGYDGSPKAEAHIYDELTDSWISVPDVPGARYDASMIAPAAEKAWMIGGNDGVSATTSCYIYDLTSNSWTVGPAMSAARERLAAATNGSLVLASGGLDATGSPLAACEISDATIPAWLAAGAMSWARYGHTLVALPDGRVAAIGGLGRPADDTSAAIGPIAEIEIFDFATRSWASGGKLAESSGLGAFGYSAGSLWAAGGGAARTYRRSASGSWPRSTAGEMPLDGAASFFSDGWAMTCGSSMPSNTTKLLIPNREGMQSRGIERFLKVTFASDSTIVAEETDPTSAISSWSEVEVRRSPDTSARPGPYCFSPVSGMVAAGATASLGEDISEGASYSLIAVSGTLPVAPGWLAMDLGGPSELGPIQYLGPGPAGFARVKLMAERSVPSGAAVSFLWGKGPYAPPPTLAVERIYCAPSDVPTSEMADLMLEVSGGGLIRSVSVRYPDDAGLGAEGYPTTGDGKLSDTTKVWSGK